MNTSQRDRIRLSDILSMQNKDSEVEKKKKKQTEKYTMLKNFPRRPGAPLLKIISLIQDFCNELGIEFTHLATGSTRITGLSGAFAK